jgi:spore coat protein A
MKTSVAGGAGLLAAGGTLLRGQAPPTPPLLTPFVDALPIPTALAHSTSYHITMNQVMAKLHRDLPLTPVWAYNGNFLGVVIEAFRGTPITVRWDNQLPSTHLFPQAIDQTLHGSSLDIPAVKTVVHMHGMKVLPQFDGYPESWFTNAQINAKPPYYRDYIYPNDQAATNLWFHDHAIGTTRLNFYAGLIGNYLLRDAYELSLGALGLPINPPYEIPLIFMDRWFTYDFVKKAYTGTMLYDAPATSPYNFANNDATPHHPIWATELWADHMLVNGKVWPYLNVEPRLYRFRTLNACNSRFLNISFYDETAKERMQFVVIGADQGFLQRPVQLDQLLKGNAERHDILIDFEGREGHTITMKNVKKNKTDGTLSTTAAPYPDGQAGITSPALEQIMRFTVGIKITTRTTYTFPATLAVPGLNLGAPLLTRDIALDEIEDSEMDEMRDPNFGPDPNSDPLDDPADGSGGPVIALLELKHWSEPTSTTPKAGSTEIWRFINATPDTHPIHVHLVEFQVLDRRQFDVEYFKATRQVKFINPANGDAYDPIPPDLEEVNAPKDIVRVEQGTVTRVKMRFDLPTGTVTSPGQHFKYVLHCHILEHEDNEMMRPFEVVA